MWSCLPLPFVTDAAESKVRPAIVVQDDVGNRFSPNLILADSSSRVPEKDDPIHHRPRSEGPQGPSRSTTHPPPSASR